MVKQFRTFEGQYAAATFGSVTILISLRFGVIQRLRMLARTTARLFGSTLISTPRCPFRKSYPDVLVVQPGQDWDGDNDTGPLDRPTQGRILAQRQVRARLIVVRRVGSKNASQVLLTEDQHPVQA